MLHPKGFLIFVAVVMLHTVCAHADQNDPRLDGLFQSLHANDASATSANEITGQIWQIWFEVDDEATQARVDQATQHMRFGEYEPALEALNEVIEARPDFAEGWNKRATLYFIMGDLARSAEDVKKTLQLEPRHFGALAGLGLLYGRLERPRAALQAFEEALEVNPWLEGPKRNIRALKEQLKKNRTDEPSA